MNVAIVMDCGSTSTRVIAVSDRGVFLSQAAFPSAPARRRVVGRDLVVWDLDSIWRNLSRASRRVVRDIDRSAIQAVTVTTFGADGAPVDHAGRLTFPVISWQSRGTEEQALAVRRALDPAEIFRITGYQVIHFNTLLKLMWLRKYAPAALRRARCFLMMPGLLSFKLSGSPSIDPTMASTTMAMDLARNAWSKRLLALAGLDPSFFPRWVEPGEVIGRVTARASRQTGIPAGVPVIAAGHDTQFAPIGAGAGQDEMLLSTGTWEILLVRTPKFRPSPRSLQSGVLFERDALKGLFNPQLLMMGSGVLEWVRRSFFPGLDRAANPYARLIRDARKVRPGSNGLLVLPSFVRGTGPTAMYGTLGTVLGLKLDTSPPEIYRATLEGLCFQLRDALEILSRATGLTPRTLRVVGGGSRNALWNQIR
ncbi:MAG: FGGY family carbohydrate kinase, partial [Planctomycetota bacterium]